MPQDAEEILQDKPKLAAPSGLAAARLNYLLGDKYDILSTISSGGWGVVYKARQRDLDRIVAIKVMHRDMADDPECVRRFLREAKTASQIQNPHVASIYEHGTLSDGSPFIVMQYFSGKDLASYLQDNGALPVKTALSVFKELCQTLSVVHANDLVHRDIKPTNLLLIEEADGYHLKLIDFGLVGFSTQAVDEHTKLTMTGLTLGTAPYMSPEQCMGHKLDGRSDIYSLGCTLYECLTLKQPFAGADQLVSMRKHLAGEVPPLTLAADDKEFEPQLQYITDKMLAMKLQNRYQSMQELENDLQECLAGTFKSRSVKAPPESVPSVEQKHPSPSKVGIALIIGMLIGLIAVYFSLSKSQQAPNSIAPTTAAVTVPSTPAPPTILPPENPGQLLPENKLGKPDEKALFHYQQAELQIRVANLAKALPHLTLAAQLAPRNPKILQKCCIHFYDAGYPKEVTKYATKWLSATEDSWEPRFYKALGEMGVGDYARAEYDLAVSQKLMPNEVSSEQRAKVHTAAAICAIQQQDLSKAAILADEATKLDKNNSVAWHAKAQAECLIGTYEVADIDCAKALKHERYVDRRAPILVTKGLLTIFGQSEITDALINAKLALSGDPARWDAYLLEGIAEDGTNRNSKQAYNAVMLRNAPKSVKKWVERRLNGNSTVNFSAEDRNELSWLFFRRPSGIRPMLLGNGQAGHLSE